MDQPSLRELLVDPGFYALVVLVASAIWGICAGAIYLYRRRRRSRRRRRI